MYQYIRGNSKLHDNILVANITPALECPSDHLGRCSCAKICYAKRSEKFRPKVLSCHQRQRLQWMGATAEELAQEALRLSKRRTVEYIRLSVAGDFIDQSDVDKAEDLAGILNPYHIKVYGYTARDDLEYSGLRHCRLWGSGFWKLGMHGSTYIIASKSDHTPPAKLCDCTKSNSNPPKCGLNCRACMELPRGRVIQFVKH